MDYPLISVIIPVHNGADYLVQCLDSVTDQTYPNTEIVCVNDCSTDDTENILDRYASVNDNIRIFTVNAKNVGVALNAGIKESKGEYIAFVDADDWVNREYLECLFSGINDADMSVCDFCRVENGTEQPSDYPAGTVSQHDFIRDIVIDEEYHNYLWHKLFRRNIVPNGTVSESYYLHDLKTLYKIVLNAETIKIAKGGMYYYRIHEKGITYKPSIVRDVSMCIGIQDRYPILVQRFPDIKTELLHGYLVVLGYLFSNVRNCPDSEMSNINADDYRRIRDFMTEHRDELENVPGMETEKKLMHCLVLEPSDLKKEIESIMQLIDYRNDCNGNIGPNVRNILNIIRKRLRR